MNAGTDRQLFPAFVFPLHDSIEGDDSQSFLHASSSYMYL